LKILRPGRNQNELYCTGATKTKRVTKKEKAPMKHDIEKGKANREAAPKYPVQGQSNEGYKKTPSPSRLTFHSHFKSN